MCGIVLQQADEVLCVPLMATRNDGMGIGRKRPWMITKIGCLERDPIRPAVMIHMIIANSDSISGVLCQIDQQAGDLTAAQNE